MAKKISVQNEGPANWRKSNTLHITSNLRVNVKNIERSTLTKLLEKLKFCRDVPRHNYLNQPAVRSHFLTI